MSRIRSKGNADTELRLISVFKIAAIRGWRRNFPLPGKPDFVFPSRRVVLFVDGCFWHGCKKHGRRPTSNTHYWEPKLARNRQRDREVTQLLRTRGWKVLRIWEHDLQRTNLSRTVRRINGALEEG